MQVVEVFLRMIHPKRKSACPINFALEIFGDRWTLLVIRDLMFKGKHYYGEFLGMEEKIATNILADRLFNLEAWGIVTRVADQRHRSKQVYRLTRKGIDLLPVLTELILWSARYDKKSAADVRFVRRAKKDRGRLMEEIALSLRSGLVG